MSDLPINAPSPRLCHIVKWPDFEGYGFNLHADKSRPGQYIGKVDESSPADVAGLKESDRIIEVNGVNIANENHKQVVQRIKAISNETRLLVVDSEADRWYKEHNLVVRGDQSNVVFGTSQRLSSSPETPETEHNGHTNEEDDKSVVSAESSHSESSTQPQSPMSTTPSPPPSIEPEVSTPSIEPELSTLSIEPEVTIPSIEPVVQTPPKAHTPEPQRTTTTLKNSGLNLNMTAAEMRAHLASKKKFDPRKDPIDLKKKYQIIQNM